MSDNKKFIGDIDVRKMLESDGFMITDVTPDGNVMLLDNTTGEDVMLKGEDAVRKYVKQFYQNNDPEVLKQVPLQAFAVAINDPDTPMGNSPLNILDRTKLSLGNVKGSIDYLKGKYSDVTLNQKGQLVVKDGMAWRPVDVDGLGTGDAFDLAKEFASDIADWTGEALVAGATIAGDIAGAPLGPAGMVAGGAGGAAVGSAIKTSLGRLVGTYDASVEEQFADIGLDTVFTALGYGVGSVAGQLGSKFFSKVTPRPDGTIAAKAIQGMKNIPRESKDALAKLLSFTTTKPLEASRYMVNNIDDVSMAISKISKMNGEIGDIANKARMQNVDAFKDIAGKSLDNFSKSFEAAENALIRDVKADGFNLQIGNVKDIILKGGKIGDDNVDGFLNDAFIGKFLKQESDGSVRVLTNKELQEVTNFGEGPLVELVKNPLRKVMKSLNSINNQGNFSGKLGLKQALELRRSLDSLRFDVAKNPEVAKLINPYTSRIRQSIVDAFGDAGLQGRYQEMNKIWLETDFARTALGKIRKGDGKQVESFLSNVFAPAGENTEVKAAIDLMKKYNKNPMSNKLIDNVMATETAIKFYEIAPTMKNLASGPGVLIMGAIGTGVAGEFETSLGLGAAGVALISPRGAAATAKALVKSGAAFKRVFKGGTNIAKSQMENLHRTKEVMTRMSVKEKAALLKDPRRLGALIGPIIGEESGR